MAALDADITGHVDDYRRKRNLVRDRLTGAYEFVEPGGGFYFFPRVPDRFDSADAFAEEMVRHNVLIIPGSVFSDRDTHFRVSYAASDEKLEQGCDLLCQVARR